MLVLALAVAIPLFFYQLEQHPPGFYIDEALVGYSARSLQLTGKDEWGKVLPFFLRFYGSYNPPLYTYLTVISEMVFGLTVFSVRFVSALAGVIGAVLIYWLVSELWPDKKFSAAFAALTYVTTPWVMFYARIGYEVNLSMVLLLAGLACLWKALKRPPWYLAATLALTLSAYTAYAERLAVPIFLFLFLVIFRQDIFRRQSYPWLSMSLILGLVLNLPHFYILFTPAFLPKAMEVAPNLSEIGRLREFIAQYSNYLSPVSLFFRPDPDPQRSLPRLAAFLPWLVIPYGFGLIYLWRQVKQRPVKFVWLMLLTFALPAALTRDPFASHRSFPLVIPVILAVSLGLEVIRKKIGRIFWFLFFILLFVGVALLSYVYFGLLPYRAGVWMAGYDKLAQEVRVHPQSHFLIDQNRLKPSYANIAFFLDLPPERFHASVSPLVRTFYYLDTDFSPDFNFGKVEMRSLNWQWDIYRDQIIVGDELTISPTQAAEHFLTKSFEIKSVRGEMLFIGWQTNPKAKCLSTIPPSRPYQCLEILEANEN